MPHKNEVPEKGHVIVVLRAVQLQSLEEMDVGAVAYLTIGDVVYCMDINSLCEPFLIGDVTRPVCVNAQMYDVAVAAANFDFETTHPNL